MADKDQNESKVDIGDVDGGIHNSPIAGRDVNIQRVKNFFLKIPKFLAIPLLVVVFVTMFYMLIQAALVYEPIKEQLVQWGVIRTFPVAEDNEILIVIAEFESIGRNDAIHNEIRRGIEAAKKDLQFSNLRVEVAPNSIPGDEGFTEEAKKEATELGELYNASMVIWGTQKVVRISVNFLNLKESDFPTSEVPISVANPEAYNQFVTEDLPSQLTFLILFAVGQSYYVEGEYDDSLTAVEKAVKSFNSESDLLNEELADAYFYLGLLYQIKQKYKKARVNYNKVIEHNSKYAAAHNNLGLVYQAQGKYDNAIADYTQAIELDSEYAFAYNNRGIAYHAKGDYYTAISDFNTAISKVPDYVDAYFNQGLSYLFLEEYELAIENFESIILLKSDYAKAHNNLCWWGSLTGKATEVLDSCERAVELATDDKKSLYRDSRGLARALAGDYPGAIKDFRAYVVWPKKDTEKYEQDGVKREQWIKELEAERNPFDDETLEELKKK